MAGRYGADDLNGFMMGLMAVFVVLQVFFQQSVFSLCAILSLMVCYYRMFSKDIAKRSEENGKYLFYRQKYLGIFTKKKKQFLDKKTHHIYKCPQCRQKIRVPKGKGMIEIRCPKCNSVFRKKS